MKICPRCMQQFDDDVAKCPDDGTRLREFRDSSSQLLGEVLDDRWLVEEKIGEGGMGEVYRARQVNVDRVVAVKILRLALASTDQYVARFFREADIATSVKHPHFVTIYDFGQTEGQLLYIAMELLEGESLAAVLKRRRLGLVEALTIGCQVCAALAAAHEARIVHRDLKPDNIFLIDVADGDTFAKVLDFGIAKDLDSVNKVTRTGQLFGTPEYMSPEQCDGNGEVDGRADLYALGCILYEALTGRSPCRRDSIIKTLLAQVSDPPRSFEELGIPVPTGVRDIVMKLLEKHPDNRYGSAIEVRDALRTELDRLRDNSGEIQVYETVSRTIRPRDHEAQTISYSDLAHPLQLEGALASSDRQEIVAEAEARRLAESEKSTENVTVPSTSSRWPLLAIAAAVAILSSYAVFRPTPRAPSVVPPSTDDTAARSGLHSAVRAASHAATTAYSNSVEARARRHAGSVALAAVTVALGPAREPAPQRRPVKKAVDPTKLDGGIGVRTETSMRARVLQRQLDLLQCYERRTDPTEGGNVEFEFFIAADGKQRSAQVTSDTVRSPNVLDCMKRVVSKLQFYPGSSAARFQTTLTFKSSQ